MEKVRLSVDFTEGNTSSRRILELVCLIFISGGVISRRCNIFWYLSLHIWKLYINFYIKLNLYIILNLYIQTNYESREYHN